MTSYDMIPTGIPVKNAKIKIIGVGGGGCNAVERLYKEGIENVELMICNTDTSNFEESAISEKVALGSELIKGNGAGMDPEVGRNAALESLEEIRSYIGPNIEVVFITAGMGGGTGTGAAPVIAKLVKEMGKLTIAVVTYPDNSELDFQMRAYEGIEELRKYIDSISIVDNQKIYDFYQDMEFESAMKKADNVLDTAVRGISEIITRPGYMNIDINDVKGVMRSSGLSIVGIGKAKGENRAEKAIESALTSPLLKEFDLRDARKKVLVNIAYAPGANLKMHEITTINDYIKDFTENEIAKNKKGVIADPRLKDDEISVTVLATGFKINNTKPIQTSSKPKAENTLEIRMDTEDNSASITLSSGNESISENVLRNLNVAEIYTYEPPYENLRALENESALKRKTRLAAAKQAGSNDAK